MNCRRSVPTFRCVCIEFFRKPCTTPPEHSGGHQFNVRVWATRRDVHLEVRDDGVGFDVRNARHTTGLGLVSMEERVKLVAGELRVRSAPNRGTTVHARVPLNG